MANITISLDDELMHDLAEMARESRTTEDELVREGIGNSCNFIAAPWEFLGSPGGSGRSLLRKAILLWRSAASHPSVRR